MVLFSTTITVAVEPIAEEGVSTSGAGAPNLIISEDGAQQSVSSTDVGNQILHSEPAAVFGVDQVIGGVLHTELPARISENEAALVVAEEEAGFVERQTS